MRKILFAFAVLALASCQHEIPQEVKPLSFEGPTYRFNVSRVDVVDDFTPALHSPRTEYSGSASLSEAMHKWAAIRLTHGGSSNILEVHITDASIAKKNLPKQKSGIEGYFTKEQTEEYEGKLSVELRVYTPDRTLPMAHSEIKAQQSHTLSEDATLQDRKAIYRRITAEIMEEVDKILDHNIHAYFANYLM